MVVRRERNLKANPLDGTVWRTRFGRGHGLVVRQNPLWWWW